jgi:hypothetical protein
MSIVGGREDTLSIGKVITLVAGKAVSAGIMGGALVRYSNADFVGVEDPSVGALKADLVVPVPGSAAEISWVGVVGKREEALSVVKIVSLVAGEAVSTGIIGCALVSNGHADVLSVEGPSFGAGQTFLVGPIPGSTSEVGGLSVVGR